MNLARNIEGLFCVSALAACIASTFLPSGGAIPSAAAAPSELPVHVVRVTGKRVGGGCAS
jgi:hypothetical protein